MPGRQRRRACAPTRSPCSNNSTRPSTAGPAATSSAATTGATASATATGDRPARTRPGPASSTTISGWTSSWPFCRLLETEPYIAVNSGLGGVEGAAQQARVLPTARPRARWANGEPTTATAEPYGVKYWGIGNEMYGGWQLGHMPLADYVKKHNEFAEAMRAVDPSITLVGVGATGTVERGHAAALRRPHGTDQRTLLLPGTAGTAGTRAPDSRARPRARPRPIGATGRASNR